MKILHTSDLHLCSRLTSRLDPVKAQLRRRELLLAFERLIKKAREHGAEAIVIAGDLFDGKRALDSAKARVKDAVLSAPDITFVYISGNHEGDALADYPMPSNFIKLTGGGWKSYKMGDVCFYGRSDTAPGMFSELKPEGKYNVAVLHGELKPSGSGELVISESEAKDKGLDYIALGHYHTYSAKKIDERCTAVYSGAPEGRGFDEMGELGYVIIDTASSGVTHKFYKGSLRQIYDVSVDITGCNTISDITERIKTSLCYATLSDIVRITLTGYRSSDFIPDVSAISDRISGDFWYFEIRDKSRIKFDPQQMRYTKSLKGEFISLVMADDSLTEEEKNNIINYGILALMGEVDFG